MATNLIKCFICNIPFVAIDKCMGVNISDNLAMPLSVVLEKCLRIAIDVEDEFFCIKCIEQIRKYDELMKQSLQIEIDLNERYQNKYIKCDADDQTPIDNNTIILDRDRINEVLIKTEEDDITEQELLIGDTSHKIKRYKEKSDRKIKKVNSKNTINKSKSCVKKPHYTIGTVTCDYCGRSYQSKGALSVHIVNHIEKSPHGKF